MSYRTDRHRFDDALHLADDEPDEAAPIEEWTLDEIDSYADFRGSHAVADEFDF